MQRLRNCEWTRIGWRAGAVVERHPRIARMGGKSYHAETQPTRAIDSLRVCGLCGRDKKREIEPQRAQRTQRDGDLPRSV